MSYAATAALQAALYQRLVAAPALAGVAIHDALPPAAPATFVLIGPEEVRDASDRSGKGALHRVTLSVISDAEGFLAAKTIAAQISDLLDSGPPLSLSRGRMVWLGFERARARRLDAGRIRRIDLSYKILISL